MSCGKRIRDLRERQNLSLEQVAREVNVPVEAVLSWEQGTSLPEPGKMLVLSAVLGTTADYLLDGTESVKRTSSDSLRKMGSVLFAVALILYFAGVGSGAFSEQLILFGMPLLNYGTSALALCLLVSAALCVAAGIFCKFFAAKHRE